MRFRQIERYYGKSKPFRHDVTAGANRTAGAVRTSIVGGPLFGEPVPKPRCLICGSHSPQAEGPVLTSPSAGLTLGVKARNPAPRWARLRAQPYGRRPMDLRLTEEELAFRAEKVRAFVRDDLPASIRERLTGRRLSKDDYVRWTRILAAKGWAAPHWPRRMGRNGLEPDRALDLSRRDPTGQCARAGGVRRQHGRPGDLHFRLQGAGALPAAHRGSFATGGARGSPSRELDPTSRASGRPPRATPTAG